MAVYMDLPPRKLTATLLVGAVMRRMPATAADRAAPPLSLVRLLSLHALVNLIKCLWLAPPPDVGIPQSKIQVQEVAG